VVATEYNDGTAYKDVEHATRRPRTDEESNKDQPTMATRRSASLVSRKSRLQRVRPRKQERLRQALDGEDWTAGGYSKRTTRRPELE
jgi:hypothetical protein